MSESVEFVFVVPNEWVEKIRKSSFEEYTTAIRDGVEFEMWNVDLDEAYALSEDSDFENCSDCVNFNKLIQFLEDTNIDYYDYGTVWRELDGTTMLALKVYLNTDKNDYKEFVESVKSTHSKPDFYDEWDCSWYYVLGRELDKLPSSMAKKEVVKLYNTLKENSLEPHLIYITEC